MTVFFIYSKQQSQRIIQETSAMQKLLIYIILPFGLFSCVSKEIKSVDRQIDETIKMSEQNKYERPKTKTSNYRWHDQKKDTASFRKTN